MMKGYIRQILLACLLMASLSASAQMHKEKRISPEEFRAKTEAFIGSKAGFTAEEAQKFFPIYHEMKGKQWKIMQEVGKLKQQKGVRRHRVRDQGPERADCTTRGDVLQTNVQGSSGKKGLYGHASRGRLPSPGAEPIQSRSQAREVTAEYYLGNWLLV